MNERFFNEWHKKKFPNVTLEEQHAKYLEERAEAFAEHIDMLIAAMGMNRLDPSSGISLADMVRRRIIYCFPFANDEIIDKAMRDKMELIDKRTYVDNHHI